MLTSKHGWAVAMLFHTLGATYFISSIILLLLKYLSISKYVSRFVCMFVCLYFLPVLGHRFGATIRIFFYNIVIGQNREGPYFDKIGSIFT